MPIGLSIPSRSLGWTHLALVSLLAGAALAQPGSGRRRLFGSIILAILVLAPIRWVGPGWSETGTMPRFVFGFFSSFFLSLAIPAATTVIAVHLGTRSGPRSTGAMVALVVSGYFAGLLLSYPVSFNYALLYPLMR